MAMTIPAVDFENFCFDLNLTSKLVDAERCLMAAPLTDEIRSNAQTCRVGVLATMVDVAGSDPVLAAWHPDWTATQDLSVQSAGLLTDGPIVVDTRLLRRGSKVIFVAADLYDGQGMTDLDELRERIDIGAAGLTLAGKSLVTFTRIPRSGVTGMDHYDPNRWIGTTRVRASNRYNPQLLDERIGLRICDRAAGIVEVSSSPYVCNSIGTINGGVQALALETAAEIMRPGMTATDIQIHYLSQLKVGPSRTRAQIIRDARGHSVAQVDLLDAGADNRLMATATVTLQRLLRRY